MEDLVLWIAMEDESDPAVEGLLEIERAVSRLFESEIFGEAVEHSAGGAPSAAGWPDDKFAIEGDVAVVIGDDDKAMLGRGVEPGEELIAVVLLVVVGVIGVEENDALNVIGDNGATVEIANHEAAAAAMAAQNQVLGVAGDGILQTIDHAANECAVILVFGAP